MPPTNQLLPEVRDPGICVSVESSLVSLSCLANGLRDGAHGVSVSQPAAEIWKRGGEDGDRSTHLVAPGRGRALELGTSVKVGCETV